MAETRNPPPPPPAGGEPDPSMDDILASIRRILSEDEQPVAAHPHPSAAVSVPVSVLEPKPTDDVFELEPSMMVSAPPLTGDRPGIPQAEPPSPVRLPGAFPGPGAGPGAGPAIVAAAPDTRPGLIAPEAEASTASAMGALRRTIEARALPVPLAVRSGGPTLDDIVREEMRPLLKAWLDANLPPLVERLVAAEIERLVARSAS